jgi:hypothetical protein
MDAFSQLNNFMFRFEFSNRPDYENIRSFDSVCSREIILELNLIF